MKAINESFKRDWIGIAYVVIPQDIDRDQYIKDCLLNETVSVTSERFEYFNKIKVSKSNLMDIDFPKDKESFGSPIVWARVGNFEKPIVISVLSFIDNVGEIQSENNYNRLLIAGGTIINIDYNADEESVSISIEGDEPDLTIKSKGNDKAKIRIETDGVLEANANKILFNVGEDDKALVEMTLEEIYAVASKIYLGSKSADESMVLGEALRTQLQKEVDRIDIILKSFLNAKPIPQDGGLALQTAVRVATTKLPKANYNDILSKKIKIE